MTPTTSKTPSPAASPWASSVRTPLLSDEELDALIQAFNRRDPSPVRPSSQVIGWSLMALLLVGLGGWWL